MARIEWVRQRLENWARWAVQREDGLGFPSQSPFARLGMPTARGGECVVPTNNIDASEIDGMVRAMQLTKSHLFLVLQLHYVKGFQVNRVAKMMCKSESSIRAHLCEADRAIAQAIANKREASEKRKEFLHLAPM